MTDKPPEPDKLDDTEAERRFNETLGRMLKTPPSPHKDEPKRRKRAVHGTGRGGQP
jgi:hypothetical protein